MPPAASSNRVFLFLQGPHGPFFHALGRMLCPASATVWRVEFNAGDRAFWFHNQSFIPYRGTIEDWPRAFAQPIDHHRVTDIVLYGDTRPIHAEAVKIARARGLCVHIFKEGYMRLYWVTYERNGTNGHSRLMELLIADMREALTLSDLEAPFPQRNEAICANMCSMAHSIIGS